MRRVVTIAATLLLGACASNEYLSLDAVRASDASEGRVFVEGWVVNNGGDTAVYASESAAIAGGRECESLALGPTDHRKVDQTPKLMRIEGVRWEMPSDDNDSIVFTHFPERWWHGTYCNPEIVIVVDRLFPG
jgi:hypothetical protein